MFNMIHTCSLSSCLRHSLLLTGAPFTVFLTIKNFVPNNLDNALIDHVAQIQSTANSNSFEITQKTAFEAKGRLYTTGKVIQRLFIIDLYT